MGGYLKAAGHSLGGRAPRKSPRFPSHRYQVADEIRSLNRDYLDRSTYDYIAVFNFLLERCFTVMSKSCPSVLMISCLI